MTKTLYKSFYINRYDLTIDELFAEVKAQMKKEGIPEDAIAHVEPSFSGDELYAYFSFEWEREETDEERANRERYDENMKQWRRKQYEDLKKEFGDD